MNIILILDMANIEIVRKKLKKEQQQIINFIWDHWITTNKWPSSRKVHHKFGRTTALAAITNLGGSVVYEISDPSPRKKCYALTFLGVLLTDNSNNLEDLLVRYIKFLIERFKNNPEFNQVKSDDVKSSLHLNEGETSLLSKLIYLSRIWGNSASPVAKNWTYGVPDDIDILVETEDLLDYIRESALKNYDLDLPVTERNRLTYISKGTKKYGSEFDFISDNYMRKLIASDWVELQKIHQAKGYKSCLILCGGILEGILIDVLQKNENEAKYNYKLLFKKKAFSIDRWRLEELVKVAEKLNILSQGSVHLSQALREYRNLVHPGLHRRRKIEISEEDADVAYNTVKICLRELKNKNEIKKLE